MSNCYTVQRLKHGYLAEDVYEKANMYSFTTFAEVCEFLSKQFDCPESSGSKEIPKVRSGKCTMVNGEFYDSDGLGIPIEYYDSITHTLKETSTDEPKDCQDCVYCVTHRTKLQAWACKQGKATGEVLTNIKDTKQAKKCRYYTSESDTILA